MFVVAVVVIGLGAPSIQVVSGQPMLTVADLKNRFTLSVPITWHVQTSMAAFAPSVSATAPTAAGQLPDSVDVTVHDFLTPITPSGCASGATMVMRFSIHTWTTLKEGPITLDGREAYRRDYVWRASTGASRRSVQTCVTIDRRAFMLVGTTANTAEVVEQNLPLIERIMATFRPVVSALPSVPTQPNPVENR